MNVSIVVATRDRPNFIGSLIGSILANTYRNFVLLIIDQSTKLIELRKSLRAMWQRILVSDIFQWQQQQGLNLNYTDYDKNCAYSFINEFWWNGTVSL